MDDALRVLLRSLERFGQENDQRASQREQKMLNITPETGELLAIEVLATRSRRILEIGTSNGYSTLWLADAARTIDGAVTTVEIAPAKAMIAKQNFDQAGLQPWIRQVVADAASFLEQCEDRFDLVFLDSNRQCYVDWWPNLCRVIVSGGLLVADNALSHADELIDFVSVLRGDGWLTTIVPVGNGELLAGKSGE